MVNDFERVPQQQFRFSLESLATHHSGGIDRLVQFLVEYTAGSPSPTTGVVARAGGAPEPQQSKKHRTRLPLGCSQHIRNIC